MPQSPQDQPPASPPRLSLPSLRSSASSEEPRDIPSKEAPQPGLPAMAAPDPAQGSRSSLHAAAAFPVRGWQRWRRRDSESARCRVSQ